jgi:hypothetical protein
MSDRTWRRLMIAGWVILSALIVVRGIVLISYP